MSVLSGALGIALALVLALFARDLGRDATADTRGQLAADAAALAAVAESGPYGLGDPESAAARFARANGARLRSCDCEPGALEMQVEVSFGGVIAVARAAIEPGKLEPLRFGPHTGGLHPQLAWAVERLTRASGGAVYVESGLRSSERQEELWAEALARYGDPEVADDWVARPGHSMHERGLAVDLGGDISRAVALIERLGLPMYRPMPWEPWHFELISSRRLR